MRRICWLCGKKREAHLMVPFVTKGSKRVYYACNTVHDLLMAKNSCWKNLVHSIGHYLQAVSTREALK